MWDFKLLNATQTLEKTMAYVMYRLVMYLVLSLFLVIAMLLGSGTGLMMGSMAAGAEPITLATQGGGEGEVSGVIGFAVFALLLYLFRGTWFHAIKVPHIVLLQKSETLAGWVQIGYAKSRAKERFPNAGELSTLDTRIRGSLAYLGGQTTGFGRWFSRLGDGTAARVVTGISAGLMTLTHEVIVARCLKDASRSASAVAAESLVYYGQNFEKLFRNSLVLLVVKYAVALALFVLILAPVGWLDEALPVNFGNWTYVFALLLTWPIKSAVIDPIGLVAMINLYSDLTEGQSPDAQWEEKLGTECDDFSRIKKQAEYADKKSNGGSNPDSKEEPTETDRSSEG